MGFFGSAITILQTLVVAIGAGLGVWGVINLMEGYGNDNPGAKSQGIKQLMSGGGVILIGTQLAKQLNISPYQLSYVTNSGEGEGLLFYGTTIIPFKDKLQTIFVYLRV